MPATAGLLGAAALAAEKADELLVGAVRDVHTSIAGRVHRAVRFATAGASTPSRLAHDTIADGVYAGLDHGLRGSARVLRAIDRHGVGPGIEDSPTGRFVVSAVNGLIGDRLRDELPELSFDAGVRIDGHDVPLTDDGVRAAFPGATGSLVVFVHGLCETERYWHRRSRPRRAERPGSPAYGERLAADAGWTPVYLRVNTGLHIAESGVEIAALLDRLLIAWPVPVTRIALVGHSMGGLIARAACAVESDAEPAWVDLVTDMITLGTPHLGSQVERSIARGVRVAARMPELAPFGRIFEQRSVGVLDLHDGMPEDSRPLPRIRYRLVAGSLTRSPKHPVALVVGDLLVQPWSAHARPRGLAALFPDASVLHIPGAGHFDLLNHDDVYDAIRTWLAEPVPEAR